MNSPSASENRGIEDRRKTMLMPKRIHEMDFGLPRSARQPGKTQRLQPVRVGPLLEAIERSSSKTNSSARRTTIAPIGTGNVRRQLYNETADHPQPNTRIIGGSHSSTKSSVKELINVGDTEKSQAVRLGLSKSDGKLKINDHRPQPIRVKQFMESWEKSQSAKRSGKKSVMGRLRSVNVRRRLYSVVASPGVSHKVAKKSLALNKPQETPNTSSQKAERVVKANAERVVKSNAEMSENAVVIQKACRKSFLLPPNSIRDKHISLKSKNTKNEQSQTSIFFEEQNNKNPSRTIEEIKVATAPDVDQIANIPEVESLSHLLQSDESVVADSSQQSDEVLETNIEIPRPTVIMGLAISTVSKIRNKSVSSECSSKSDVALSHPPLQNLHKNSMMPLHRQDAIDTSLQDLFVNSENNRKVSSNTSISPNNNCLRNCENSEQSLIQMNRQTLFRFYENTKLCIQTTEESLFSMKKMLKTIEDVMNSSEPEEKPLQIEQQENYDEDFAEENKENLLTINGQGEAKQQEKNGENTRKRLSRLAAIEDQSIQNSDDSFLRIEEELNTNHKSKPLTPNKSVPVIRKIEADPRSRRSIREYMALKSCTKFLQTPDHKGLPTPKFKNTGTPAQRRAAERALSIQVLNQLHNLYDESPE